MNTIAAFLLAGFLVVNAVAHFVKPGYVRALVPSWLGHAGLLVAAGGVALLAGAALLIAPATRALGAWVAAVLIAVFVVAHVDGLVRAVAERPRRLTGATAKVLLNVAYIAWAVAVAVTVP